MWGRINTNIRSILKRVGKYCGWVLLLETTVLTLCSWNDLGIVKIKAKIILIVLPLIIAVIFAIIAVVRTEKVCVQKGQGNELDIIYGDILDIAFEKGKPNGNDYSLEINEKIIVGNPQDTKAIVVIPVNRNFDLVSDDFIIPKGSLIGQWVERIEKEDKEIDKTIDYNEIVHRALLCSGIVFDNQNASEKKGNLEKFPAGTIMPIKWNHIEFWLLAFAEYADRKTPICKAEDMLYAMQKIFDYYQYKGCTKEIYIPMMADKRIKPSRSTKDVCSAYISVFKLNSSQISGRVSLVIFSKQKDEVSICDFADRYL